MNIVLTASVVEMPVPQSNLVIESIHSRTNMLTQNRPRRLEPIIEDDEGESREALNQSHAEQAVLQPSSQNHQLHGPRNRRVVWFCCQCAIGPYEFNYVIECLDCYHARCSDCRVESSKV